MTDTTPVHKFTRSQVIKAINILAGQVEVNQIRHKDVQNRLSRDNVSQSKIAELVSKEKIINTELAALEKSLDGLALLIEQNPKAEEFHVPLQTHLP